MDLSRGGLFLVWMEVFAGQSRVSACSGPGGWLLLGHHRGSACLWAGSSVGGSSRAPEGRWREVGLCSSLAMGLR